MVKMETVKEKARIFGISPGKLKKAEIIKRIQEAEGNFPCFGTAVGGCSQTDCIWREDCLS